MKEFLTQLFLPKRTKEIIKYIESNTEIDLTQIENIDKIWDIIIKYINTNATKIKIDLSVLSKNINFLNLFSNLQELDLSTETVTNIDDLKNISHFLIPRIIVKDFEFDDTSIKGIREKITINGVLDSFIMGSSYVKRSDTKSCKTIEINSIRLIEDLRKFQLLNYNDLELIKINDNMLNDYEYDIKTGEITIKKTDTTAGIYNFIKLLRFNNFLINSCNIKFIALPDEGLNYLKNIFLTLTTCNINDFVIKITDYTVVYKNGKITQLKMPIESFNDFKLYCDNLNIEIENMYIKVTSQDSLNDLNVSNCKNLTIEIPVNDLNQIEVIINDAKNIGAKDLIIDITNINIYDENIDYSKIENIENPELTFKYFYTTNIENLLSKDELLSLVESVKWYKKIIKEGNLSPVEKLMYAYDIMKTFKYSENNYSSLTEFRAPHQIINNGNIVCAGYTNLFCEIIKDIDPGLAAVYGSVENENHARVVCRVDDDKYNIHGVYTLDPTNDSVKVNEPINYFLKDNYNALDLYQYFLVPYKKYENAFGNNNYPEIFTNIMENPDLNDLNIFDNKNLTSLFNENYQAEKEKVQEYIFNARSINLEDLKEMLKNVRLAEGYSEEEIKKEIDKIILVNRIQSTIANKDFIDYMSEEQNNQKTA